MPMSLPRHLCRRTMRFHAKGNQAHAALDAIRVELDASIVQEPCETFPVVQRITDRLSRGAATRQLGCLEPVTQVTDERCASIWRTASLCLGRAIPIMPGITGLGSFAGTPMHSVDSVRTVFHHSQGIFSFGPHRHHEPVGRCVAAIDLHIAWVRPQGCTRDHRGRQWGGR
jgi:hypothetical protein